MKPTVSPCRCGNDLRDLDELIAIVEDTTAAFLKTGETVAVLAAQVNGLANRMRGMEERNADLEDILQTVIDAHIWMAYNIDPNGGPS